MTKPNIIERGILKNLEIDTENRTLIIGFNEPKFRGENKDSKLNARFITYFLPAVELARMQKKRPRLNIVSGLNMALKWNALNEEQKKIMMADNAIKFDFLKEFFSYFFPENFSLIEYIIPQDVLKVSESKFIDVWNILEKKYSNELEETKFQLIKFLYPKKFNVKTFNELNEKQKSELEKIDPSPAFKYAIGHLFTFGDVNFEGNYIHNSNGYFSIGGEFEIYFNTIRNLVLEVLKENKENLFGRDFILYENKRLVLKNKYKVAPAYNGFFDKNGELSEVTFENERSLDYYNSQEKLKDQMDYMYENLVSKREYQDFWDDYRKRYFDLKNRYREAYNIQVEW